MRTKNSSHDNTIKCENEKRLIRRPDMLRGLEGKCRSVQNQFRFGKMENREFSRKLFAYGTFYAWGDEGNFSELWSLMLSCHPCEK